MPRYRTPAVVAETVYLSFLENQRPFLLYYSRVAAKIIISRNI